MISSTSCFKILISGTGLRKVKVSLANFCGCRKWFDCASVEVCHLTGVAKTTLEVVITTPLDNTMCQIHLLSEQLLCGIIGSTTCFGGYKMDPRCANKHLHFPKLLLSVRSRSARCIRLKGIFAGFEAI